VGGYIVSPFETIKAAYTALGRNDPSVLFAAMDSAITWNEAEGNPLADRNPYIGPQAVGEGGKAVMFQQYTDTAQWARL
jgi:hypothetical protein